jgi:uncharacterized membrane protein
VTEHRPAPDSGHGLERVLFFSDAVIAIALTLLALDLKVPAAGAGKSVYEDFLDKLGHEYLAFLISFGVIAMFWYRHHRLFQYIARLTTRVVVLNLLALLVVVLMPFATRLTTDLGEGLPAAWGTVAYAGLMCVWAAVFLLMAREAQREGLWVPTLAPPSVRSMTASWLAALIPFVLSMPAAFIAPGPAKLLWILAAPLTRIAGQLNKRRLRRAEAGLQHKHDNESESATV